MKDVAFGQYYPTKSFVHSMDARVKILSVVAFIVAVFLVQSLTSATVAIFQFIGYLACLIFVLGATLCAKVPLGRVIKSIKGIGTKSAQRLILELKDKVVKGGGTDISTIFTPASNPAADEATTALVMLGFTKANVNKAVSSVLKSKPGASLEEIIKLALKLL